MHARDPPRISLLTPASCEKVGSTLVRALPSEMHIYGLLGNHADAASTSRQLLKMGADMALCIRLERSRQTFPLPCCNVALPSGPMLDASCAPP